MDNRILLGILSLYATSIMLIFLFKDRIQIYTTTPMIPWDLMPPFTNPSISTKFNSIPMPSNLNNALKDRGQNFLVTPVEGNLSSKYKPAKSKHRHSNYYQPSPKIVVHWTKYNKAPRLGINYGYTNFMGCRVSDCVFLPNTPSYVSRAHALVFSPFNGNLSINYPSQKRDPKQVWIFFSREPPINLKLKSTALSGINWTMTFRQDSDIPLKWGYFVPSTLKKFQEGPFFRPLGRHKFKTNRSLIESKSLRPGGRIAWFVSNCRSRSKRHLIARELGRYLPIDVYGGCGNKTCPHESSQVCYENLQRNYKFYLSFENSLCSEYITEKLFKPLSVDVLPIVYGGGDYRKILPPSGSVKAFVNVLDFLDIEALARYLLYLDRNPLAYQAYFEWKKDYKIVTKNPWCSVCQKLHDPKSMRSSKWYGPIMSWYRRDVCIPRIKSRNGLDLAEVKEALETKDRLNRYLLEKLR